MSSKQYSNLNAVLTNATYNFEKEEGELQISINTTDTISIEKISEKSFVVLASRKLCFEPLSNTYIQVTYEVQIGTNEKESVAGITQAIKEGNSAFGAIFTKASLLISQITNEGAFGPIITVPMYNPKTVEIITKI